MVLKKKVNYGFSGYRVPVIPRGPRSVRRRGSHKRTVEDSQICAFELLAAVAGKLLLESEGSASSNAAEGSKPSVFHSTREQHGEGRALRPECLDQGSCIESVSIAGQNLKSTLRDLPRAACDTVLEIPSILSSSHLSKKVGHDVNFGISEIQAEVEKLPGKVEGGSPSRGESCDGCVDNGIGRQLEAEENHNCNTDLTTAKTFISKDPMEIYVNTHQLTYYNSSVQLTSYRDSRHRNNVKVGHRDDDENHVGCNRRSSKIRSFRPQTRIGHRRIRKLLTSKYWKVAPKLKNYEFSNTDGGMKRVSCNRKVLHTSERAQREGPFKKRRLFDHSTGLVYNREGSSESISNSPEKGMKGDKIGSTVNKASGISPSVADHQVSFQSRESHVKLSIKSFKVPELYIEVPESTTVGSLKRTVMEAVTAILQGGLHVGVLLRGKTVKDDNRTLLQTGISHNENLETLGFTFEPSSAIAAPSVSPREPPVLLPCEKQQQLTRLPASPILELGLSNASCDPPSATNADNNGGSNRELTLSLIDVVKDGTAPDSRALVALPAMSVEALAVVPSNPKTRRSELVQRRTRRPFSVSEVEALVEAVETLGTGRWRDVKMRAFENADHRTYVDLKDKWKTLVHTATIAPQQRRGEPVPQELLDRVLSAHGYWSQKQSKLHGKHQTEPLKISNSHMGGV
ncbi:TRF-like 9 [Actinidia rufa]|uniref:TRF-like 9 n=1 Tax=Actinidia rufa TaxID=165716 RepID=A0A7J0GVV4_9ERIC|nr:TRF-like 9 [Actinidia rufa]